MRLLFLALSFPLPANNGHKIRTWALLRALAAEGHEVSLLAFAREDETMEGESSLGAVCRDVDIVPLVARTVLYRRDIAGRLASVPSPRPYGVTRFESAAMRDKIVARIRREPFDAIVCDVFTIANVPPISIPIIVNNENVEHVLLRRYLPHEPNPVKRAYASLEALKMERWERRAWARAAVAMACSDVDRRTISRLCPECPTVIVPNVVDAETYMPNGAGQAGRVLFQGGMDWFPNQDAAAYFISEILPTVRSLVPHVRFVVAGRNPSPTLLRRFARITDVEFTGTVPDMRDELAKAAVCAVPLRIGSGTRLKILEAAAMARAVVSTPIGMEGLGFTDGWDILVADGPHAFAHALVRVLRSTELGGAIGSRARHTIEADYTFANLRVGIRASLDALVQRSWRLKPTV